ncbi:MAG: SDR family oxidoreductase [Gammaproteobacteria bacterium]|nr:SDR family oxidoreductase [Gammaproteobacteria bacterium]
MSHQPDLSQKVAVVSGAGRGIGRAIALGLANAGMRVVCAARSAAEIERTATSIRDAGGQAHAQTCDVSDPDQVERLFAQAARVFGGIDLVLVNAGVAGERADVADSDIERWRQTVEVNLHGAYLQCRTAIPHLRARGGGKILLMGSGVARNAMPGSSAYACAKAGLAVLTRVLAQELRADRIAVNEIIPGPVRTTMTGVPEERESDDSSAAPILSIAGEWAKNPEDVVPLALFLAGLPEHGPSGQSFSLVGRDLGRI